MSLLFISDAAHAKNARNHLCWYVLGNSWGTDVITGKSCVGCGNQEQFYACADVAVLDFSPINVDLNSDASTTQHNLESKIIQNTTFVNSCSLCGFQTMTFPSILLLLYQNLVYE